MKKFEKALVTGGAGFIGSNLVEGLVDKAGEITVVDNLHTGSEGNLESVKDEINFIQRPVSEIKELDIEPTIIFHLGIPSSSPMYKENHMLVGEAINDFIRVMNLAKEQSCDVVYASTSSMYGPKDPPHREDMEFEPFDYYTEARLEMERIAEMYNELHGVNSAGMRFFSVYGPHERAKKKYANIISQFCWKIQDDEPPVIFGDGTQTRDFTYVKDVVRAILMAAEKIESIGADSFNIGTGRETNFNEVVEELNEALGKDVQPKYVENPIDNYVERTEADTSKTKRILSFEAEVPFEEGVRKIVQYYSGPKE